MAVSIVLVAFAAVQSFQRTHTPSTSIRLLVVLELMLTVTASTVTGGIASPFVLTPVTGLLLAGYVWGRRATVGTAIAGLIAAAATITMQSVDATDQRAAGQIAVVFLLCGALGAFTRNLISEIESHRAAARDQAVEMATANELLVSLHALAQTLPSSFDLARGGRVDARAAALRRSLQRARGARARRRAIGVDRRARRRRAASRRT